MDDLRQEESQAIEYAKLKGWSYSESSGQLVTDCPLCGKPGKFYMNLDTKVITAGSPPAIFWDCKHCGEKGNLKSLKKMLGDPVPGLVSMQDGVQTEQLKPLPDLDKACKLLRDDGEVMDYLVCERGYTVDIIEKMRLGLGVGTEKWIVYPYINAGKYTYAKMRTVPPAKKDFRGAGGRENPLYNADAINCNTEELIFVEGEGDCLSMLSNGYPNTIGVPGANMKKTVWIDRLDEWWKSREGKVRQIYVLYDSDKVGQDAAAEITKRIGIDRVKLIKLPDFSKKDGQPGKDINEWWTSGHNREEFEALKTAAKQLEIKGVMGIGSALDELEDEIDRKGNCNPTYDTPWPSLTHLIGGGEPGDVIVIMAEGKRGKTTLAMNWLDYFVGSKNLNCLLLCFEMSQKRIARKWASYVTGTDDSPGKDLFSKETINRAREIIRNRIADLVLGYCPAHDKEKVFELIRQAVRRYGIKCMVLDNLQLMTRSVQNAASETSALSKSFKDLAVELGILILEVVQPNRVREGEIISYNNAMNSSAIDKDCDVMICLHRNRSGVTKVEDFTGLVEENVALSPYMLVKVDLARYASGGATTLYIDGGCSTVREMKTEEAVAQRSGTATMGAELPIEGQSNEL